MIEHGRGTISGIFLLSPHIRAVPRRDLGKPVPRKLFPEFFEALDEKNTSGWCLWESRDGTAALPPSWHRSTWKNRILWALSDLEKPHSQGTVTLEKLHAQGIGSPGKAEFPGHCLTWKSSMPRACPSIFTWKSPVPRALFPLEKLHSQGIV